jgi:hypothetical protein
MSGVAHLQPARQEQSWKRLARDAGVSVLTYLSAARGRASQEEGTNMPTRVSRRI